MKTFTPWFLLVALLIGVPAFALAEDTGGTADISVTSEPVTTGDTGASGSGQKPPRPTGLNGLPPGQPVIKNMMEKRAANGVASGTPKLPPQGMKDAMKIRMENGTSGKPIPPGIKDRMMNASGTRAMIGMGSGTKPMMCSGTPKMLERMKMLKDGKMDREMEAAKSFIKMAGERMNNAIERLDKIEERLKQAVAKFKEKGIDTSDVDALLVTAQSKISLAKSAVAEAIAAVDAAKPSSTGTSTGQMTDTTRQTVKDAMEKAKNAIMDAHKALVDAISALKAKGGVGSGTSQNPGNSTTTP